MEYALIICRSSDDLDLVDGIETIYPIVVASNDFRVVNSARKRSSVANSTFLEKKESFWEVSDHVIEILEQIDRWLVSLEGAIPDDLLAWGKNIEGGKTNQRVQDALLFIRSCLGLLEQFNVCEVHILANPNSLWEDRVVANVAESRSILVKWHGKYYPKILAKKIKDNFLPFAKAAYQLYHEIMLGAGQRIRRKAFVNFEGSIVFQLCSSLEKHVDNVKYIMKALKKMGRRPIGLCWSAKGYRTKITGSERLEEEGLESVELVRYVSLVDMLKSLWYAIKVTLLGRNRKNEIDDITYMKVPVVPLLKESFRHFFAAEFPQRLRYASALERCFSGSSPIGVKPWGGTDFFDGKYLLTMLRKYDSPYYFHYWVGMGFPDWPYTDASFKPDLFLAKSDFESELAQEQYQIKESATEVVGQPRFNKLKSFDKRVPPAQSREQLGIPQVRGLHVGLDPNAVIRGYQTLREQVEMFVSVLDAYDKLDNLIVVIKPHPSYRIDHLYPLINDYETQNIVILNGTAPVDHFLNAVDILITKHSTLILEAAILNRCAISACFDGEERFKLFGDLPKFVQSGIELKKLMVRLASNLDEWKHWRKNQLARQQELLPKFYNDIQNASTIAAERIIKDLRHDYAD